eukprot:m.291037 g.291037  ORF g.291037 m.291037 type:complete len:1618 (+) comp16381_c0_seq4:2572-7425(+)
MQSLPAARIDAVLKTSEVYSDMTTIGTSFRLRDDQQFSSSPTGRIVIVELSGMTGVTNTAEKQCTGAVCDIDVNVNAVAFTTGGTVTVSYGFKEDTVLSQLGTVLVNKDWHLEEEIPVGNMYGDAPKGALFEGDEYEYVVRSSYTTYLLSASITARLQGGIEIKSVVVDSDVFLHELFSFENDVAISIYGRKDSPSFDVNQSGTQEILFRLQVRVTSTNPGTIELYFENDVVDVRQQKLPKGNMIFLGRDPLETIEINKGFVHTQGNEVIGILPFTTGPTEIVNTALLSGQDVLGGNVVVTGIRKRGTPIDVTSGATCQSTDTNVLETRQCRAVVQETQTVGAREVAIRVQYAGVSSKDVPFRVHRLASVTLTSSRGQLRPIDGYFDESDTSCSTYVYEEADIIAIATFTDDGVGTTISGYDVSSEVRLISSQPNVAAVTSGVGAHVTGVSVGTVTITVMNMPNASVGVQVLDTTQQNRAILIGLDVVPLSGLGPISVIPTGPYAQYTNIAINLGAPVVQSLKFEDDAMYFAATAVFDDGYRLPLRAGALGNGLVLESNSPASLKISSVSEEQRAVVVRDPMSDSGELVQASWRPQGLCSSNGTKLTPRSSVGVTLLVDAVPPTGIQISKSIPYLVSANDVALSLNISSLVSTLQLSVFLEYPDPKGNVDITDQDNLVYSSSNESLLMINDLGVVTSLSTSGTGFITVAYGNLSASLEISVVQFARLEVKATPYPTYPSSENVSIRELRIIECSNPNVYQNALFHADMVLTNGQHFDLRSALIDYHLSSDLVDFDDGVLIPSILSGGTSIMISASLKTDVLNISMSSPYQIDILSEEVVIESFFNMEMIDKHLVTQTTLSGGRNQTQGQIMMGMLLSDGRQIVRMFDEKGQPTLDGVISFSYSSQSMTVDERSGTVRLLDNAPIPEKITASICRDFSVPGSVLSISLNLQPIEVGDIDLGQIEGPPIPPCGSNEIITLPVRVNTDMRFLQAFDIRIEYEGLEFLDAILNPNESSAYFSAISLGEGNIQVTGLISLSTIRGDSSNGYKIFDLRMRCVGSQTDRYVRSYVYELLEDTSLEYIGVARKANPQLSNPGSASIGEKTEVRNRRDSHVLNGLNDAFVMSTLTQADADCDGSVGIRDIVFILSFLEYGIRDFLRFGPVWETVKSIMLGCNVNFDDSDSFAKFDLDGNGIVDREDVRFLYNVNSGVFFFAYPEILQPSSENNCETRIRTRLVGIDGTEPRVPAADTKVFLHITSSQSANIDLVVDGEELLPEEPTAGESFGGLIEVFDDDNDGIYEYNKSGLEFDNLLVNVSVLLVTMKQIPGSNWVLLDKGEHPSLDPDISFTYSPSDDLPLSNAIFRPKGSQPLVQSVIEVPSQCLLVPPDKNRENNNSPIAIILAVLAIIFLLLVAVILYKQHVKRRKVRRIDMYDVGNFWNPAYQSELVEPPLEPISRWDHVFLHPGAPINPPTPKLPRPPTPPTPEPIEIEKPKPEVVYDLEEEDTVISEPFATTPDITADVDFEYLHPPAYESDDERNFDFSALDLLLQTELGSLQEQTPEPYLVSPNIEPLEPEVVTVNVNTPGKLSLVEDVTVPVHKPSVVSNDGRPDMSMLLDTAM